MSLFTLARSSLHLNAISNRLSATSPRSRNLGVFVGIAISQLIDKPDARMTFSIDIVNSAEAQWYLSLTGVKDSIGSIQNLKINESRKDMHHNLRNRNHPSSEVLKKGKPAGPKIVIVEEMDNKDGVSDRSDDDDLI